MRSNIRAENLEFVLNKVRESVDKFGKKPPLIDLLEQKEGSDFRKLVGTLLSSRTKDETTAKVMSKLFDKVKSPEEMSKLTPQELEKLLYPVGFYKTKAKQLVELAKIIVTKYNSRVPTVFDELVKLPGVGRKTANVFLAEAVGEKVIGVDVHVHRISNRWGLVRTRTNKETEEELHKLVPDKLKNKFNRILVAFGQTVCTPVSPWCSKCLISELCPKIGVDRRR